MKYKTLFQIGLAALMTLNVMAAGTTEASRPAVHVPKWVNIQANIPYEPHHATVLDVMWPKTAVSGKRPGVICSTAAAGWKATRQP